VEEEVAMPWGRPLEAKKWIISLAPGRSCGEGRDGRRVGREGGVKM